MDVNNILSQFGGKNSKETIYMSVTPGVGLELIRLDLANHAVRNYAYRPLQYNESLRQISDIEEFRNSASELFDELNISPKSNIILNIPMVHFGSKELPLLLADDAVTEALVSEVEQSYIFKRYEPSISWVDSAIQPSGETRKLFYTAIQKNVVDDIETVLNELGMNLVGVEVSLTSILKALLFSGLTETQMKDNITWNLMLVSQSGYSIISMVGKHIVEYYEEPIAIKSFEGEEIYNAISSSAQITLMNYPANYLYIISETDFVSAEFLAGKIQADGTVDYLDNNSFRKQDILPVSLEVLKDVSDKVSLEAIGIASPVMIPEKFNFISSSESFEDPNDPVHVALGNYEFFISPNAARNIVATFSLVLILPFLAILLILPTVSKQKEAKLDAVNSQLEVINREIDEKKGNINENTAFDINTEIEKVLSDNRTKLIGYSALGESVTKKLWITYFSTKNDGEFDIKGASENVEDIYTFFRSMKDSLLNAKLRIHKLEMKTNSVDEAISIDVNQPAEYEFEITNLSEAELTAAEAAKADAAKNNQNPDQNNPNNNNNNNNNN